MTLVSAYEVPDKRIIELLRHIVGDTDVIEPNELDKQNVFDYAPLTKQMKAKYKPALIVRPRNTEDVSQILALANEEKIPVIASSGLTSLSSSAVAKFGGIQLDMKNMNSILEVNKERFYVVVQPGVVNFELDEFLRTQGFMYPHDPGSGTYSTVGGSLATSGAGQLSFKYGALTDQVIQIEVVIPGGKTLRLGQGTGISKVAKASTCYDLKSLFVGSFGTLGVITEAIIKIYPKPAVQYNLLFSVDNFEQAIWLCDDLRKAYLPCVSQILAFNGQSLVVRSLVWLSHHPEETIDFPQVNAGVWVLVEGDKDIVEIVYEKIGKICRSRNARYLDRSVADIFYKTRHLDSYNNDGPRGFDPDYGVSSDAETVIKAKRAQTSIFSKYDVDQILDECWYFELTTMHNTAPYLVDEADEKSVEKHAQVYTELCKMALSLDGSITGGHGPCFSKFDSLSPQFIDLMKKECGPALLLSSKVKEMIDPNHIMNPGMLALDKVE